MKNNKLKKKKTCKKKHTFSLCLRLSLKGLNSSFEEFEKRREGFWDLFITHNYIKAKSKKHVKNKKKKMNTHIITMI